MDKYALVPMRQIKHILNNKLKVSTITGARSINQNASMGISDAATSKNPDSKPVRKAIKIPERIERSPTDILKVLAGTVGRDYTAPHYKFHDDPYLIPPSNISKRIYALSKESGRKAAKWVRQQHPELYYNKNADPPVMAFLPDPTVENAINGVTEETIQSFINLGLVSEAVKSYEVVKGKGEPSREIKQALLEMLAFYNEFESLDDHVDERWFEANHEGNMNKWKNEGVAEKLFEELSPQDAKAYAALIRGTIKYRNLDRGYKLYQEALSKNLILDTPTFNAVVQIVPFVVEHEDLRLRMLEEILVAMKEQGCQPDLGTLNAALRTSGKIGSFKAAKTLQMQIMSEFKQIGVTPSLGSYSMILQLFCRDKGPRSTILYDIMDEIEGKEHEIRDSDDVKFFVTAMEVCRQHLQDLELADRVHKLLMIGRNYDLIGDGKKESVYYRNYVALRVNTVSMEEFFKFYDQLVPNVYIPEPSIMEEILRAVQVNGAIEYIPQMFSDMIQFDHVRRENLLTLILQILNQEYPYSTTEQAVKLGTSLADIGWKVYGVMENQKTGSATSILWTGNMLGDLMSVLVKANYLERAGEIMKKLITPSQKTVGAVPIESLNMFLQALIQTDNSVMCLACLQYATEIGYSEVPQMAEEVFAKVQLDAVQKARLNNMVGFDVAAKVEVRTT